MNRSKSTYCQIYANTTYNGVISSLTFTGNDPRKGWRIPLNEIKYNEQRDEEKEMSGGHFASERGEEPRSGMQYCSSLSFTNFGARYMDHELMTGWLSVDPMADKYPSISPYNYCMWNPVKLVDPDGKEIHLTFIGKNTCKALNKIINEGLGGQFKAAYSKNKDGSYTLSLHATEGGGNKDKLTERQLAFYEMLSKCIDAKKTNADISVVYGSGNVHLGNYTENTIDVADMLQFDDLGKGPATKQGKLVHEFVEQYEKASCGWVKGENKNLAENHQTAISAENYVNGSSRKDFFYNRGVYGQSYTDKSGKVTNYYYSTCDAILKVRKGS